ncbi:hypothetical protein [Micromonospora sp. NBC_01796]|uniref:hypothetical protein n=1 Tax=Micromonospora sp. NBC_01796 TaxID=2975987 RepID=UPI002DD97806|nr:hypothetical protein [Micromonospora sp. NBC_01796]WSA88746.1 hypothetical protein OIE47_14705 [Micromonospora sp. NBC_01796]
MTELVKVTVNLTPDANDALTALTADRRTTKTDALCRALRVAAALHGLAPGGRFTIVPPDGDPVEIWLV